MKYPCALGMLLVVVGHASTTSAAPSRAARTELASQPTDGRWQRLCSDMKTEGHDKTPVHSPYDVKRMLILEPSASYDAAFATVEMVRKRETRTFILGANDGSVIGVSTDGPTRVTRCVGQKVAWTQPIEVAPTSVVADDAGNVYYAGVAGDSQGTDVVLGKLRRNGSKAWEARVDGPGNQSEATLRLAPDASVHVLGTSASALPGQPASAAGSRFVAKYGASGKQEWLRQSPNLGKPTTKIEVRAKRPDGLNVVTLSADSTPSTFDVDAQGNAYVVTMLPGVLEGKGAKKGTLSLARVVKLDAKGAEVKTSTVKVSLPDPLSDLALTRVLASGDGEAVYLVLGRLLVKLDGQGQARWARAFFIAPVKNEVDAPYVNMTAFVDAAHQGGSLYLLSRYTLEYDDGMSLPWERSLVVALDEKSGKPQWARKYGASFEQDAIQALPNGALLVTLMELDAFDGPITKGSLYELSDVKAAPQQASGKAPKLAAAGVAAPTVPVAISVPEQPREGSVEEMCPIMPVFGWERDFDLVDKRGVELRPGVSPKKELNSTAALLRRESHAQVIGSAKGAVIGIATDDGVSLRRCVGSKYAWTKALELAPTALATDSAGNVYYAGVADGAKGTYIELTKLTVKGAKAWSARIDGPGRQSEARLRVAPDGKAVYVLGLSTHALPGQPAESKGHRFVARFGASGKQEWLRQSVDFGKPTTKIESTKNLEDIPVATLSQDSTPTSFDLDGAGNVYVAAGFGYSEAAEAKGGPVPLARVVKLGASGELAWTSVVKVTDGGSPFRRLASVVASENGDTVFVLAGYFVVQLDGGGTQQWTRRLTPPAWVHPNPRMRTGEQTPPRGDAATRGGRLYVVLTHDGPSWGDGTLAILDAAKGELESARLYSINGWAGTPTIQLLPNGSILLSAPHESYDSEHWGSSTTLWRVTDAKAPAAKRAAR